MKTFFNYVLILIFFAIVGGISGYVFYQQFHVMTGYQTTTGQVQEAGYTHHSGFSVENIMKNPDQEKYIKYKRDQNTSTDQSYFPYVKYRYQVNGKQYRSIRIFPSIFGMDGTFEWAREYIERYNQRKSVQVYFNPGNPSEAYLEKRLSFGMNLIVYLGIIVFAILGSLLLLKGIDPAPVIRKGWFLGLALIWEGACLLTVYLFLVYSQPPHGEWFYAFSIAFGLSGLVPLLEGISPDSEGGAGKLKKPLYFSLGAGLVGGIAGYFLVLFLGGTIWYLLSFIIHMGRLSNNAFSYGAITGFVLSATATLILGLFIESQASQENK